MNRIAGTITAVVGETPTQRGKLSALSAGGGRWKGFGTNVGDHRSVLRNHLPVTAEIGL
jgi:hypothetical protein